MKKEINYWLNWKLYKWFGFPEHYYHWYRCAYKVARMDRLMERTRKQIEAKYKLLFLSLDLDWNGYRALIAVKQKELDDLVVKVWTS